MAPRPALYYPFSLEKNPPVPCTWLKFIALNNGARAIVELADGRVDVVRAKSLRFTDRDSPKETGYEEHK